MSFVTAALGNRNTCPQSGLHGDLLFIFQTSLTSPGRARPFLLSACQGFHSGSHISHIVSPIALVSFSGCPWSSLQHSSTASTLQGLSARVPRPLFKDATETLGLGLRFKWSLYSPLPAHMGFEVRLKTDLDLLPKTAPRASLLTHFLIHRGHLIAPFFHSCH